MIVEILKYLGLFMAAGSGAFLACAFRLASREDRQSTVIVDRIAE